MNKKISKHKRLRGMVDRILWMAIRYSHGRHTYAPSIVREVVKELKEMYPDFELRKDVTINPPTESELMRGFTLRSDWLDDLFEEK